MMTSEVAKWSARHESVFIQIMAEHVRKGNRTSTTFTSKAWAEIAQEFNETTGNDWKREKFRNKFNKLRVTYREFKKLRDQPKGFGWDPKTKSVTTPDDVWENYLKLNPNARQFKNKGCPHFDELDLIYGDSSASEAGARATSSTKSPIGSGDDVCDLGTGESKDAHHDVGGGCEVEYEIVAIGSGSRTPTSDRRKRRADDDASWRVALMAFSEAERKRAESERTEAMGKAAARVDDRFSVQKATELLAAIPDVPIELYIKAGERIIADAGFREFFICSPAERRKELLEKMP